MKNEKPQLRKCFEKKTRIERAFHEARDVSMRVRVGHSIDEVEVKFAAHRAVVIGQA